MAQDVDEILVGANGTIRVAPVGTAAPADETAAPAAGWVDLGFTDDNGVTFQDSKTLQAIAVWQLFYAARRIVTARDFTVSFALRQWDKLTVPLAFGGGAVTLVAADHYKYTPPSPADVDERALMVDWADGTKAYRLMVPRGLVTDNVQTQLHRPSAADLPITFSVIGSDSSDPWYLLTNDPSFA